MRWVNGCAADSLSLADRAFQFGDGVFRSLRCEGGGIPYWGRHLAKLAADCAALGIAAPDEAVWHADLQLAAPADAAIKLTVTRGESVRGYAVPQTSLPNRVLQLAPLPPPPPGQGVRVRWCEMRAGWQPRLAGVKHLNRLENVMARAEWCDPEVFEGLLLDRDGHVLEGVMSNVLALSGRVLFTPRLDGGGVAGVMRGVAIDAAARVGVAVRETALTPASLLAADRLWLSNSLIGLVPVRELAGQHWGTHPLDAAFAEAIAAIRKEETLWLQPAAA
ncbi:aminodeoxychorismate lyase [Chitiniphilus purpureus]|uniref:aminodeoxychorismate lyase n=1 Tax=Chitiniphilus purpureus TaxID=2981137 RepID=A0ABY6DT17_9NEIS|nr:aminodeoxychorismate lyase [Chitiniphilus sp. CD1]UXY16631.1 aminodeoxychorismate lyase [Chitiniphilus sp. CD1]